MERKNINQIKDMTLKQFQALLDNYKSTDLNDNDTVKNMSEEMTVT